MRLKGRNVLLAFGVTAFVDQGAVHESVAASLRVQVYVMNLRVGPENFFALLSLAESVYGGRERALAWLRKSHTRLDGRTPLSLLKTDTGSRIVEELLVQIDEGMFV